MACVLYKLQWLNYFNQTFSSYICVKLFKVIKIAYIVSESDTKLKSQFSKIVNAQNYLPRTE